MLKKLIKRLTKENHHVETTELDYHKLPVLTAEQLIHFTAQQNRLRSIKRIIKIDDRHFDILYLGVIHQFAEMVQLMPASQAHHHAVPGGLFIHTLEVIENAMRLRQQYKLPAFAEQEVQERERHVWTYAIFTAAILHDIGKRLTMCIFIRDDGKVHSAFDAPLSTTACKHYKLIFQDPKYYALHDVIGLSLIDILPPIGKTFLFEHLHIIKEMIAYIHGDKANAGMIGEIISKADQQSTGQSLAHISTRKFKGASLENIGERLMTQLRQMIASNNFVINKNNANIYVSKDGYTYCIAKVIVDAIRDEMSKNNDVDIPHDNNRIFDIFQEYGFAETNSRTGKSIHTICLYHNGTTRVFTVLKFVTSKLFRVEPKVFEGVIEEVASKTAVQSISDATEQKAEKSETAQSNNHPATAPEKTATEPQIQPSKASTKAGSNDDLLSELLQSSEPSHSMPDMPPPKLSTPINNTPPKSNKPKAPPQKAGANPLAYQFLQWCRDNIKDKSIIVNESNGMIQKVNYKGSPVIAVVTPRIFYEFATVIEMKNPKDKSSFAKIQSAIHKEKLNIPGPQGQIHMYKIKKSHNNPMNGNIKIRHYLFEIEKFADGDSEFMELIETIPVNSNLVEI